MSDEWVSLFCYINICALGFTLSLCGARFRVRNFSKSFARLTINKVDELNHCLEEGPSIFASNCILMKLIKVKYDLHYHANISHEIAT
jgi:hypothetical protein